MYGGGGTLELAPSPIHISYTNRSVSPDIRIKHHQGIQTTMETFSPTATITGAFYPNPTCYIPGHFSQVHTPAACYTGSSSQGGGTVPVPVPVVTCQRATYGPDRRASLGPVSGSPGEYYQKYIPNTGCFPNPHETAITECPAGFTTAAVESQVWQLGEQYITIEEVACCPE